MVRLPGRKQTETYVQCKSAMTELIRPEGPEKLSAAAKKVALTSE